MNHTLTVRNAYGRDFKSKKEILEHYNSNKDFQNLGIFNYWDSNKDFKNLGVNSYGAYVNKKDAKRFKVGYLNVRYNNLMKIAVINVSKDKFQ